MKFVFFGLSVTSSWGNGHATTYRALLKALHARGHRVVFFEKDTYWYADNRDLPHPEFCDVRIFEKWKRSLAEIRRELADADAAVIGSYFPDGIAAIDLALESRVPVTAFYDIDTPITVSQLRAERDIPYLRADQIPRLDVYFSFTGGPLLTEVELRFGCKRAIPLYCSVDENLYAQRARGKRYACDLSYMGTYAADRQPKIDDWLLGVAASEPKQRFILAGPQYPAWVRSPGNVRRIEHLNPRWHPHLYSSSRFVLNVTRRDMVMWGFSPSVRLFEAAACGATMISDNWAGLDTFFRPGSEILLPTSSSDVRDYLNAMDERTVQQIGAAAQARVLEAHSSTHRAIEFENAIASRDRRSTAGDVPVETLQLIRASL